MQALCSGDPHFKGDNTLETDQMSTETVKLCVMRRPDVTIVLGDVLHTHEKLYQDSLRRAIKYLLALRNVSKLLVILIGNHDRPNNNVFLTDEHPFTALTQWERTLVVWKPEVLTFSLKTREWFGVSINAIRNITPEDDVVAKFLFMPYVPVGRFREAIDTCSEMRGVDIKSLTGVFAHQEFKNAKMGAIVSKHGDEWPLDYPLVVSGHVHDFDILQPNLIYTGTPIQHGFGDTRDKKLMLFNYGVEDTSNHVSANENNAPSNKVLYQSYERFSLGIPSKINVRIRSDELLSYMVPPDAHVKLSIEGDPEEIRALLKLDSLKPLLATPGLVIKIIDKRVVLKTSSVVPVRSNMPFQNRLISAMQMESTEVRDLFGQLFGGLPPAPMPVPTSINIL